MLLQPANKLKLSHMMGIVLMATFQAGLLASTSEAAAVTKMLGARQVKAGVVEQRLLRRLLRDYDTDARGVSDPQNTVTVSISLLLLRIQALDERIQVLTTTGLIICDWRDERLVWDPKDYHNVTDIVIRPDRIWLPELALMNGAQELAPDFSKIRALVSHDGSVHWEPGSIFSTTCDIDIRYFPFDEQRCPIQIGAWAYFAQRMNITNGSDVIQTKEFRVSGEWEILYTQATGHIIVLPTSPDIQYPFVEFTVGLRRRYTFYMMNIILPCSLLSVLVMVVFCLPPDAGEKISLGISVLLAFAVFLLMVAENIPRTSLHVPVIVMYLTCTMFLGTLSVCMTVLVLNIHHRDSERPVPKWVRVLCFKYLARMLCVTGRKPKSLAELERRMDIETHHHKHETSLVEGLRQVTKDANILQPLMNGDSRHNTRPRGCHHQKQYTTTVTPTTPPNLIESPTNENEARTGASAGGGGGADDFPLLTKPTTTAAEKRKKYWHNNAYEWKEVAHILDQLFFILMLVFMTASFMIIIFVPFYKQPYKPRETIDPNA